jgi:hypothetical protein
MLIIFFSKKQPFRLHLLAPGRTGATNREEEFYHEDV